MKLLNFNKNLLINNQRICYKLFYEFPHISCVNVSLLNCAGNLSEGDNNTRNELNTWNELELAYSAGIFRFSANMHVKSDYDVSYLVGRRVHSFIC